MGRHEVDWKVIVRAVFQPFSLAFTHCSGRAHLEGNGSVELKLRAARDLALDVNEDVWQTVQRGDPPTSRQQCELRATATYCTEVALDIVTETFRYTGGSATYEKNVLQRYLRDLNAAAQHLMVSEIAHENLGQTMLGATQVNPMR